MDAASSIILGVVSGVLTSAVLFASARILTRLIIPWYEERVYKGVRVEGSWILTERAAGFDPELPPRRPVTPQMAQYVSLEFAQYGNQIRGDALFTVLSDSSASVERIRRFRITGELSDRFLVATLRHAERGRIGFATLLLEVVLDGQVMDGEIAFYSIATRDICAYPCVVRRGTRLPQAFTEQLPLKPQSRRSKSTKKNVTLKRRDGTVVRPTQSPSTGDGPSPEHDTGGDGLKTET